jgi:hypothetical protein
LDGNIFFEEQGIPILKIALNNMLFEEALPEPFSVAIEMLKSLINGVSKIEPPYGIRAILKCYHNLLKRQQVIRYPGVY